MDGFHLPHRQTSLRKGRTFSLQSTFPIKLYQPEEDPTVGQISGKDIQYVLCLVVNTSKINELIFHFLEKIKTEELSQKCSVKKVFLEIL